MKTMVSYKSSLQPIHFQTRSEVHCPHELRRNVLATAREAAGVRAGAQAVFVSVEEIGADVVVDVGAVGADIHRFFGITSVFVHGSVETNGMQWDLMG